MKNIWISLQTWKVYEVLWLMIFTSIAVMLTILWKDSLFGLSVFVTGVLCVVLAAKGNILTYFFGMYNTFGYAYLVWRNHLYGELWLNLAFFVPMNLVGFLLWRTKMKGNMVEMKRLTKKWFFITILLCIVCIVALGYGLSYIPNQNNPYMDATTNVLSIIATLLMVWRYKEQWLLYIVLNIFTVILWIYRFMNGSPDSAMMMIMWSAYLVNAIYGWINWSEGSRRAENGI